MATYFYVVLTRATPGKAAEFHQWYDDRHLADCVRLPEVKSAKRYRLEHGVGAGSVVEPAPFDSLAIYEIESDDPVAVARELTARAGTDAMPMTDAIMRVASVRIVATAAGSVGLATPKGLDIARSD